MFHVVSENRLVSTQSENKANNLARTISRKTRKAGCAAAVYDCRDGAALILTAYYLYGEPIALPCVPTITPMAAPDHL